MLIVKTIAIFLIVLVVASTLIPFLKKEYWWIRIFDFPRLQILGLGAIAVVLYLIVWQNHVMDYIFIGLAALSMLWQLQAILPYTPFYKKQVITCKAPNGHPTLSLVVMNVYMYNKNAEEAKKIIKDADPDVVIAIETSRWWKEQLDELKEDFPNHVAVPLDNTYGMMLFSKLKLIEPAIKYILDDEAPSIHTQIKLPTGDLIRFFAVHPKPPAPGHNLKSTDRDAELITIGKITRNTEKPVIVAGDLNDVAWSHTTNLFQRFSELLDPRVGRGMFNTFNARHKFLRWPLDHIFHSDHFQLVGIRRLPFFGSDHFPIFIKLCYMPAKQHQQEEPEALEEDVELAEDKLDRTRSS